jgi:hypothetical protein
MENMSEFRKVRTIRDLKKSLPDRENKIAGS